MFLNIEIQSEYKVIYYDYEKEDRVVVDPKNYTDKDINYLYVDDGILYIEIDNEED